MNRILSIVAICAILGAVSAAYSKAPVAIVSDAERTGTGAFNAITLARYTDSSRIVILGANSPFTTLTRRYIKSADLTKDGDDAPFASSLLNCPLPGVTSFAYSQNGYVAAVCETATTIVVNTFKTDANITNNGTVISSDNIVGTTPISGLDLDVTQVFFQDDYFYVVFSTSTKTATPTYYVQGVQAKDGKTLLATAPVKINPNPLADTDTDFVRCGAKSGNKKAITCYYLSSGKITSSQVDLGSNTAGVETAVSATLKYAARTFSTANGAVAVVTDASADTGKNNVGFSINGAAVNAATVVIPANTQVVNVHANNDGYVAILADNKNTLTYTLLDKNGAAANATDTNSTNVALGTGLYSGSIDLPDTSLYIAVQNTADTGVALGQVLAKTGDKTFASILKCTVAGIFMIAALFAF